MTRAQFPFPFVWSRLVLCVAVLLMGLRACEAQTNSKTYNHKDGVMISKITPRTNAEIPLPASDFVIYLELRSKMMTTPTGEIHVDFYRYSKRSVRPVHVAPTIRRTVQATVDPQKWLIQSAPITIASADTDEQIYVKAYLLNSKGKVVGWSESFNPLRGQVTIRPNARTATRDSVRSLPGTTPANTRLGISGAASFVIRLHYDVKSSPRGVINIEFGELRDIRKGAPWSVSVVEVPAGSGEVEIRRSFPLVASLRGTQMAIGVSLLNDPLSGSISRFELQPYLIGL